MTPTNEQKIRECAEEVAKSALGKHYLTKSAIEYDAKWIIEPILTRHFGQPEQNQIETIKKLIPLCAKFIHENHGGYIHRQMPTASIEQLIFKTFFPKEQFKTCCHNKLGQCPDCPRRINEPEHKPNYSYADSGFITNEPQPDKSLDEIVEKPATSIGAMYRRNPLDNYFDKGSPRHKEVCDLIRQACIEYAAQVRQSAAREAAKVVEPWNIHGYSTGSGKDFIYPTEAILAHFNITETKGVKE